MDSVGEGEGGKIWENGIETCKISCMKWKKKKKNILLKYDTYAVLSIKLNEFPYTFT